MSHRSSYLLAYGVLAIAIIVLIGYLIWGESKTPAGSSQPAAPSDQSETLPNRYSNVRQGFSIRYPAGYAVDEHYAYQGLGPGKTITGVKFTIPASLSQGTNLAEDSYISVESIPHAQYCSAALFLYGVVQPQKITESFAAHTTYSVASSTGAGAGNRYEEWIYAIPGSNPCIAVRYFIHYGAIENYPMGAVKEFDHAALMNQFDMIRRSLSIGP